MLRQVTSILILVILLFTICGYYPLFKIRQSSVRKEIKKRINRDIPENELHLITFTEKNAENIDWEDEGKEFIYQNHAFDVVKCKKENGLVSYSCVNDTNEEQLFTDLDEMENYQPGAGNNQGKAVKNLLKTTLSLIYLPSEKLSLKFQNTGNLQLTTHSISYTSDFSEKIKQPPKLFV